MFPLFWAFPVTTFCCVETVVSSLIQCPVSASRRSRQWVMTEAFRRLRFARTQSAAARATSSAVTGIRTSGLSGGASVLVQDVTSRHNNGLRQLLAVLPPTDGSSRPAKQLAKFGLGQTQLQTDRFDFVGIFHGRYFAQTQQSGQQGFACSRLTHPHHVPLCAHGA